MYRFCALREDKFSSINLGTEFKGILPFVVVVIKNLHFEKALFGPRFKKVPETSQARKAIFS